MYVLHLMRRRKRGLGKTGIPPLDEKLYRTAVMVPVNCRSSIAQGRARMLSPTGTSFYACLTHVPQKEEQDTNQGGVLGGVV